MRLLLFFALLVWPAPAESFGVEVEGKTYQMAERFFPPLLAWLQEH